MENCHFCKMPDGRPPHVGMLCGVCFSCALDRKDDGVYDACLAGTFNHAQYVEKGGKQQDGTTIQTLILSKETFPTMEAATKWVTENDFKADKVDETEDSFRFRQRDPAQYDPNGFGEGEQFRTITVSDGVQAVVGFLTEDAEESGKAEHSVPLPPSGTCPPGFPNRRGNTCFRDEPPMENISKYSAFTKIDEEQRIVTGPVLVPNVADLGNDFEFAKDIEKAAHGFMEQTRVIGEMHKIFGDIGVPVESWLTREKSVSASGKELPVGTWMLSTKIVKDETWAKVKSGELNGYSIGFNGLRTEVR